MSASKTGGNHPCNHYQAFFFERLLFLFLRIRIFYQPSRFCWERYDDTDLLLREYSENNTWSARASTSVARVNAIHAVFSKEISNADMLYVLALFATLPAVWIDR